MKLPISALVSTVLLVVTLAAIPWSFTAPCSSHAQSLPLWPSVRLTALWDGPFPSLALFDSPGNLMTREFWICGTPFVPGPYPTGYRFDRLGIYLRIVRWPNGGTNWTFMMALWWPLALLSVLPTIRVVQCLKQEEQPSANNRMEKRLQIPRRARNLKRLMRDVRPTSAGAMHDG